MALGPIQQNIAEYYYAISPVNASATFHPGRNRNKPDLTAGALLVVTGTVDDEGNFTPTVPGEAQPVLFSGALGTFDPTSGAFNPVGREFSQLNIGNTAGFTSLTDIMLFVAMGSAIGGATGNTVAELHIVDPAQANNPIWRYNFTWPDAADGLPTDIIIHQVFTTPLKSGSTAPLTLSVVQPGNVPIVSSINMSVNVLGFKTDN